MSANRVGFQQSFIALKTILIKETLRFMRIWTQTLFPPAITMGLYFLIFGQFIGSQIQPIHNFTYIQYIVPGLMMMSLITSAYVNTASSFFLSKFNKSIEEMLVSPMPSIVILLGYLLGGTIRGLLVGFIVLMVALMFTHLSIQHVGIMISMAVLAAMLFSVAGLLNGIYAKNFDDISYIPTFVITPLTYLGGVFYSLDQLPPFWRTVSLFNPIFNIVDSFRFGILGISDLPASIGFALVFACFITLFTWAWWCLEKGVRIKV